MNRLFILILLAMNISCNSVPKMVDPKAEPDVALLYKFLQDTTSAGFMFGHQDAFSYGIGWKYEDQPGACDVQKVCGDYPAVFGWDLGHIETGSPVNIDSVNFDLMRSQIVRAHKMGAINTISWHPTNPVTGGNTWDVSVRVVQEILPGGSKADKYKQWLTTVGTFIASLKDENGKAVPVIFRPYHEHTGSWFWWGDKLCTQDEFKSLWKYTVTYLRDSMQVHNVLYAYSTDKVTTEAQYLDKYPGDEWVDILGIDVYDFPHNGVDYNKVMPECLGILSKIGRAKNKPYALTETGNLCVKPEKWWTESLLRLAKGYGIRWALVWINIEEKQYYGPYPGQASAEDFKAFYRDPATIFASDLPDIFGTRQKPESVSAPRPVPPMDTLALEFKTQLDSIFRYWSTEGIDPATGNFYGSISHFGVKNPKANKGIIMYTRHLWAFSAAAQYYKSKEYAAIADRTFQYLQTHFYDAENGGYYWETDCDGKVLEDKKQTYAQAFALYALTEYAKLAKSPEANAAAHKQFECIMTKCYDQHSGGYLEGFNRQWVFDRANRLSVIDAFAEKSMNTNLHIMEAFTSYYNTFGSKQAHDALQREVLDFSQYIVGNDGHLILFMDKDWKPASTIHSYGHDIEASWLLWEAAEAINDPVLKEHLRVIVLRMADVFIKEAIDKDGGVFNEKDYAAGHLDSGRFWWVQCEAMEGLANAYSLTGNQRYLRQLDRVWYYVQQKMLDHEHGEWYRLVDASGKPNTAEDKGGMWKTAYHNGRALMRLVDRFEAMNANQPNAHQ